MVLHGTIIRTGVGIVAKYFPRTIQAIKRQDVRIHKSLYGASGGRGVRHGRDIGAAAGSIYSEFRQENDVEDEFSQPENGTGYRPKTRQVGKTRGRYARRDNRRCKQYHRYNAGSR